MSRFRLCLLLALLLTSFSAHAQSGIIAGAIRWDAWYSNFSSALSAQQALGPAIYQSRAPINCSPLSTYQITCPSSQSTIDAEITAAVSGGLKYWAFNQYAAGSSLITAWNLYQTSSLKNNINWCWITTLQSMGTTGNFTATNAAFVAQFGQSNYQKVTVTTASRPVLYMSVSGTDLTNLFGGSLVNVAAMITDLRAQTVAAGLGTPYIIVMGGVPATSASTMTSIGADAIGAYTPTVAPVLNGSYPQLDTAAQAFWAALAVPGVPTVPTAINGFFQTPRIAHPESFGAVAKPYFGINNVFAISTNAQLVTHLAAAVTYINAHTAVVPSKLLLIYAWTECDEGGCLTPTLGDPTGAKLAAIKATIN